MIKIFLTEYGRRIKSVLKRKVKEFKIMLGSAMFALERYKAYVVKMASMAIHRKKSGQAAGLC